MTSVEFVVEGQEPGQPGSEQGTERLDRWLAVQMPQHSRSVIQRWIKEGKVLVNQQPARANYRVVVGDKIRVESSDTLAKTDVAAEALPLAILYEDQDIVVINKAAGMVVHPAPGHTGGTVVNAVLHHIPDLSGIGGELRPGIVHRLDKDTSGTMVVAKHEAALRHLQAQFKSRKVEKHYIALVEGKISEDRGRIDAPIGRDPRNRKRMAVLPLQDAKNPAGLRSRTAVTEYETLARFTIPLRNDLGRGSFSLVQAHPITGRTHQIRVHFAWQGHPLVADPIYGLKQQRLSAPRLFLHAARLAFALPSTGEWMEFNSPLPPDLQGVLDRLIQET